MADFGDFGDFGGDDAFVQQPAQQTNLPMGGGFQAPKQDEEDWTEEEQALIAKVQEKDQARKLELYNKQTAEQSEKKERKAKAEKELAQWRQERDN